MLGYALLFSGLVACLLPRLAVSEESTIVIQRSVDITSQFQNLSFEGAVEMVDAGDNCHYRIPDLTIRFVAQESLAIIGVELDSIRVRAFAASSDRAMLLELRYPLTATLSSEQNEVRSRDIKFTIPKTILRQTEYIALAAAGQPLQDWDRPPLPKFSTEDKERLRNGRALWPISARAHIVHRPDHEGRQKAFADPDDPCSPVKIR